MAEVGGFQLRADGVVVVDLLRVVVGIGWFFPLFLNGCWIFFRVQDYRDQIGIVSQIMLWNCSLRENIRYGDLSASDEDIDCKAFGWDVIS